MWMAAQVSSHACRYVAREVLNDDRRSLAKADVFALGASLYELACNTRLPEGVRAQLYNLDAYLKTEQSLSGVR